MSSEYPNNPNEIKVLKRTPYTISAKHCLWFAWATGGFPGPKGELEAESKPPFDTRPLNATQVTITVLDANQRWGHNADPGRASGANGLDGSGGIPNDSRGLEMQEYKSATFNSLFIDPINTHLNKMLFMLETDGVPTAQHPGEQLPVRSGIPIPAANATRIFIGMHDGHEWKNNDGVIQVTVEWA
jgi:hypothetical protein